MPRHVATMCKDTTFVFKFIYTVNAIWENLFLNPFKFVAKEPQPQA